MMESSWVIWIVLAHICRWCHSYQGRGSRPVVVTTTWSFAWSLDNA